MLLILCIQQKYIFQKQRLRNKTNNNPQNYNIFYICDLFQAYCVHFLLQIYIPSIGPVLLFLRIMAHEITHSCQFGKVILLIFKRIEFLNLMHLFSPIHPVVPLVSEATCAMSPFRIESHLFLDQQILLIVVYFTLTSLVVEWWKS